MKYATAIALVLAAIIGAPVGHADADGSEGDHNAAAFFHDDTGETGTADEIANAGLVANEICRQRAAGRTKDQVNSERMATNPEGRTRESLTVLNAEFHFCPEVFDKEK
jgi:hypothetical protein